jgi:hypothetical protein
VCVNEGSGYQAPRTSHELQTELLTSHECGMRVRGDGELDHHLEPLSSQEGNGFSLSDASFYTTATLLRLRCHAVGLAE